eukprot:TRINITY_DN1436_c0_g1_i1.p1 TRINITY_DN1436_c0_g1~~TRINITY_DN1436_c0_g1_i1.p1  ORF type:complete len:995 (-),score=322.25 TRINITY_DN1436_c0_g1_i1:73-3057(-)
MSRKGGPGPSGSERQTIEEDLLREEPVFIEWVRKRHAEKIQDRLLAIGKYRVISVKKNILGKLQIQRSGHIFDLAEIFSPDVDQVVLNFREFVIDLESNAVPEIIHKLRLNFQAVSYNFPDEAMPKITLLPHERVLERLPPPAPGPAHGLLETYDAFCEREHCKPSPEFVKYVHDAVETGSRELILDKLPGIERKTDAINLVPIQYSLRYNGYFKAIVCRNIARRELVAAIADTVSNNTTVEKLVLSGVDGQESAFVALGVGLKGHRKKSLTELNVSNNGVKDKGMMAIAEGLQNLSTRLEVLNVGSCGSGSKGMTSLLQTLATSKEASAGLREVDFSDNLIQQAGSVSLASWLSQESGPRSLRCLHLSNTKLDVQVVMRALRAAEMKTLEQIDLSLNKIEPNSAATLASVIEISNQLKKLNLSNCSMSGGTASVVLNALSMNTAIRDASVNLSDNDLAGSGAQSLADGLRGNNNIGYLVMRKCGFRKDDLEKLIDAVGSNEALKVLDLSMCFAAGHRYAKLMEALAFVVASHPSLLHLNISGDGNKYCIGKYLEPFVSCLKSDTKLQELNIAGNKIGDPLGVALADALRTNKSMRSLSWDRNALGIGAWQALQTALNSNLTLCHVPNTTVDLERAAKESKTPEQYRERVREVMDNVQFTLRKRAGDFGYVSIVKDVLTRENLFSSRGSMDTPPTPRGQPAASTTPPPLRTSFSTSTNPFDAPTPMAASSASSNPFEAEPATPRRMTGSASSPAAPTQSNGLNPFDEPAPAGPNPFDEPAPEPVLRTSASTNPFDEDLPPAEPAPKPSAPIPIAVATPPPDGGLAASPRLAASPSQQQAQMPMFLSVAIRHDAPKSTLDLSTPLAQLEMPPKSPRPNYGEMIPPPKSPRYVDPIQPKSPRGPFAESPSVVAASPPTRTPPPPPPVGSPLRPSYSGLMGQALSAPPTLAPVPAIQTPPATTTRRTTDPPPAAPPPPPNSSGRGARRAFEPSPCFI